MPTTIEMTLLVVAGGGKALAGAAVYLWHCDIDGRYSMYDQEIAFARHGHRLQRRLREPAGVGQDRPTIESPSS